DKEVGNPIAKTHKEEREPLTSAVNLLVAKTKHLNYSDAYKLVHQRFNVKHIDEIPYDEIPVAVEYVHYLIALYSQTEKQGSLFDKDDYELIRQMTEAILAQNGAMDNVWKALELVAPNDFIYFHQYIMESNVLARKVSIGFDFKTKCGTPLVDQYCRTINFSTGARMGVNPKWFNAPA
ncbi:MAG: alpha/beta hydrolase, partial [Acinetobacter sp.]|nr:alpha/beta hydrolase [Acinetobacter sp.]